jgi:prolipoprotein diacylglyceryltransferase
VTGFWVLDYLCLAAILTAAVLVLRLPSLSSAVMAVSAMGTVLSLLLVVVGAIALPALFLIAIGKVRTDVHDRGDLGEREDL